MSDAYGDRNSQRSNAPCGHFRSELVTVTVADEIRLSGSPIEYFCHVDYQNADHQVDAACDYAFGVAGLHRLSAVDTWVDPATDVTGVSRDGYTISLSTGTFAVGDIVEVFYYSTGEGNRDHQTASQVGDCTCVETFDAAVQKINDCPPLKWDLTRPSAADFDMNKGYNDTDVPGGGWTTLLHYSAPGGNENWSISDTPFYITGIALAWVGDTLDCTDGYTDLLELRVTIDSGTPIGYTANTMQRPCGSYHAGGGNEEFMFINLGLIECESDIKVEARLWGGNTITGFYCAVSGWSM